MAVRKAEGLSSPKRRRWSRAPELGPLAATLGITVALGCSGSDDIDSLTFGGPDGSGDGQAGMGGTAGSTHGGLGGSGVAGGGSGGATNGGGVGGAAGGQGGTAGIAGSAGQGGSLGGSAGTGGTVAGGTAGTPGDAGVTDASNPPADATSSVDAGTDALPSADAAPDVVCTGDFDADGFCDELDNCPHLFNDDQADFDGDGVGYACDSWVELPAELWDPADTTWRFSLSSRGGVHVVAGAPRKAGGGAAGAVVFESGAYFTTHVSSVGSNEAISTFLGPDGVGWVGFGTQETIRVLDGVVSSPYGYASLFNSPDGGVFAWSGGNVDVWNGATKASVIVAQSLSPLSFNQVTYFIVDEGSGPALRVYDSTGQVTELVPATQAITSVGGIGGQVFCYTDGVTAHLAMYDNGSIVAGWPLTVAGGSCTDAAQIAVRVGDLQRSNEPSGAVWYRTFDDGASQYVYYRAAAPKDPPTVMGTSAGKTNAALMPGVDLYLLTQTPGGASELLYLNAGSLQSIRSWSVPVGTEARGGADPLWTYWVEPAPGTAVTPSVVSVERVVAGTISGPFALPTDGYDGYAVTWTDVAPSGELWLDVLHGGPTAPTYDLFVVDGISATKVASSGGASVTGTWPASGAGLVGTAAGIYVVQGTSATLAAASVGPHQLVLKPPYGDGTDGSGWWWVTFPTASGVWSVARWQDTTFDVMLTSQSAAATGSYDSSGNAYMVSGDSTFALSHLAGGAITTLLGGLDTSPLVVNRGSTLWVAHTVGGITRLSPVSGGSAGSAVLYADGGIAPFGSVYEVGVFGPGGTVENALCAFDVAGPSCTDAGAGGITSRASAGPDAGGTRAVVATSDAAGAAYLWRNVETVVPSDCCAPSATEGSCSSASVASCVCAADETCCTGTWSVACVALVSSAGCGSCVP